jgi:two-component system, OmpR family, response regulator
MRILLVDDEIELISTLAERLGMRGVPADYVTSGQKALEAVASQSYDLAVLDLKMAGLSGIETMERLRAQAPQMKFIILTGHGDEDEYKKGQAAGCAFYLMKPLDIEVLIGKIRQALNPEAGKP